MGRSPTFTVSADGVAVKIPAAHRGDELDQPAVPAQASGADVTDGAGQLAIALPRRQLTVLDEAALNTVSSGTGDRSGAPGAVFTV